MIYRKETTKFTMRNKNLNHPENEKMEPFRMQVIRSNTVPLEKEDYKKKQVGKLEEDNSEKEKS